MQGTEIVSRKKIDEIMQLAFHLGEVQIFESDSEKEKEIVEIKDFEQYLDYFQNAINSKKRHIAFGLHYKEANGFSEIRKVTLNPKYCGGKEYRYKIEGWGIIYIQLAFKEENIECRIAVNTEKRAENWESTNPELKSPSLWNWKIVESKVRNLIRELRKNN